MDQEPKPTIDERLEALTHNLELMSHEIETIRASQERLDRGQRQARQGLLAAYLIAVNENQPGAHP